MHESAPHFVSPARDRAQPDLGCSRRRAALKKAGVNECCLQLGRRRAELRVNVKPHHQSGGGMGFMGKSQQQAEAPEVVILATIAEAHFMCQP